jgi:hypothetical protein
VRLLSLPFHIKFEGNGPLRAITRFLNGLITPDATFRKIEDESFLTADDRAAPQLPEDFPTRDQVWRLVSVYLTLAESATSPM